MGKSGVEGRSQKPQVLNIISVPVGSPYSTGRTMGESRLDENSKVPKCMILLSAPVAQMDRATDF